MSRGSKNKKLFLWLILAATIILIIISQTAFAVGERDLEQAMQSYSAGQYKEAVPQFEKAATLGNNKAQTMLGVLYFQGKGCEKDYVKAAEWFDRAANGGNIEAQTFMGIINLEGLGTPKNEKRPITGSKKPPVAVKPAHRIISAPCS